MSNTKRYYVGIDIGTTNAKVLIINENTEILTQKSCEYPVDYPNPGWAEQHPEMWWETIWNLCLDVVAGFKDKSYINAIAVSGQMHGLVTLDNNLDIVRPAILWNDQRSARECDLIIEQSGGLEELLSLTNNNMLTGYTGSKIVWLQRNEVENSKRVYKILLPKDYIRYKLTGKIFTDTTDASGTGLYDIRNRCWSEKLLNRLNIPLNWFPEVIDSMDNGGYLRPELAKKLELKKKIPVIAGAGDAVIQPLGSGILDYSEGLLVIGTGGNVTAQLPGYIYNKDGKLQVFCGVFPGSYVAMGVTLCAGDSLRWLRNLLQTGMEQLSNTTNNTTFSDLSNLAQQSTAGANNLLFLPYLNGERCPYSDHFAKGSFIGLNTKTSLADMVRAIMEGVSFSLKDVTMLIENSGINFKSFCLSGGGSRSELWRQILADVLNKKITTVATSSEGSAFGAALLAGMADNAWSNLHNIKKYLPITSCNIPDNKRYNIYKQLFQVYHNSYPQLKTLFNQLKQLTQVVS